MWIKFTSDEELEGLGFRIKYTFIAGEVALCPVRVLPASFEEFLQFYSYDNHVSSQALRVPLLRTFHIIPADAPTVLLN